MTLEPRVELKLLGIIGDPDSGLCLRKEVRAKLEKRLKESSMRMPLKGAVKRFA